MPTYSGKVILTQGVLNSTVHLPGPGFDDSNYSVSVSSTNYESSNTWVKINSGSEFVLNSYASGEFCWNATNQEGPGTQVLYGTANPPPAELGNVGDSYINTASGNMYSKTLTTTTEWTEHTFVERNTPWTSIASSAAGDKLAACVDGGYIWTSTDSGQTWVEQTGSGERHWNDIDSSADGTKLVATSYSDTNTYRSYIYTSTDSGQTWVPRYNAGYYTWNSVSSDSTGTVLVACTYESQYFYVSKDSGETWVQQPIAAESYWSSVAISSDAFKIVASDNGGYLYVGTRGQFGYTWVQQQTLAPTDWTAVTSNSDGSVLAACGYRDYIYVGTLGESGYNWVQQTNVGRTYTWVNIKISADGSVILAGGNDNVFVYVGTLDAGVYTWVIQDQSPGAGEWYALSMSADGRNFAVADYNSGSVWTYNGPTYTTDWTFELNVGGATGSIPSAAGPTGAIQLSDGAGGFTGSTGFYLDVYSLGGPLPAYSLYGGPNGNTIGFDDGAGNMQVAAGTTHGQLSLGSGSSGLLQLNGGILQVQISGDNGSSGQYLGSDGANGVTWSTPSYPTAQGPTGAIQLSDGAGGFTGSTGFYWDIKAGSYLLKGGVHGNYIQFDNSSGNMQVHGTTGSVRIQSDNNKVALQGTYLQVSTNSSAGTTGQYLGSDGTGNVTWSTPSISGLSFSGPTGAILYYDGSAMTGSTAMTYNGQYTLQSINNSFALDDGTGNAQLTVQAGLTLSASPDIPGNIALTTGNGRISLITAAPSSVVLDEPGNIQLNSNVDYYLQVSTKGSAGTIGQYLGSDGRGNVVWSTPDFTPTTGLMNTLQIVPVLEGQTSSTIYYSGAGGVGTPSSWVPGASGPDGSTGGSALPLVDGTDGGWRNFKQVGTSGFSTKVEWFPYNPHFVGGTYETLPWSNPETVILKKDLQSLWAIITTKNRINVQGTIFFNIYTYDATNAPTPPLYYTNRFDYTVPIYPTNWGGPATFQTTLSGGFRYLICAVDTPHTTQLPLTNKTVTLLLNQLEVGHTYTISTVGSGVNWTAMGAAVSTVGCVFVYNGVAATGTLGVAQEENAYNGQLAIATLESASQTSFLRDPYDIYTNIPHIPFNANGGAKQNPQPADISNVAISAICISTSSAALSCPTLDFTVERIGFSANTGTINNEYILNYTP